MTQQSADKQRILGLVEQFGKYAKSKNKTELAKALAALHDKLRPDDVFLCVAGEFKEGKSSLITALLEQDGICPIDVDIATSVVSIIRYGEKERVRRYYGNPAEAKVEEITLTDIRRFCVGNEEAIDRTYLLEIEVPNPRLKSGLVLMDTPGEGGLDPRHGFLTAYFRPKANIMLYVFDVTKPLTERNLAFIKLELASKCQHLVFALTKADLVEDTSRLIEDARRKIAAALNWPPERVQIIPVSSRRKMRSLKTGDPNDLRECNFPELEDQIPRSMAERARTLQLRTLDDLEREVQNERAPLLVQSSKYRAEHAHELENLRENLVQKEQRAKELARQDAAWRIRLVHQMQDAKSSVLRKLRSQHILLNQSKFQSYLHRFADDGSMLLNQIEADSRDIVAGMDAMIDHAFACVCEDLRRETKLDIVLPIENSKKPDSPEDSHSQPFSPDNIPLDARAWAYLKNMTVSAGIATAVASVVGSVVALGGFVVLFPLAGIFFGFREARTQLKKQKIERMRETMVPILSQLALETETYIDKRMLQLERSLQEHLYAEIKRAEKAYEDTLAALRAADKRTKDESAAFQKQIEPDLRFMETIAQGIARIRQNLAGTQLTRPEPTLASAD